MARRYIEKIHNRNVKMLYLGSYIRDTLPHIISLRLLTFPAVSFLDYKVHHSGSKSRAGYIGALVYRVQSCNMYTSAIDYFVH